MQEVFRALVVCGFEWKVTGPYQIRCLTKVGAHKMPVKITLQLFKVKFFKYFSNKNFGNFNWLIGNGNEIFVGCEENRRRNVFIF